MIRTSQEALCAVCKEIQSLQSKCSHAVFSLTLLWRFDQKFLHYWPVQMRNFALFGMKTPCLANPSGACAAGTCLDYADEIAKSPNHGIVASLQVFLADKPAFPGAEQLQHV